MKSTQVAICRQCGRTFVPARNAKGWFCSRTCSAASRRGPANPRWKGGHVNEEGYREISTGGHVELEHRMVMSAILGRPLKPDEVVHHRDRNTLNNDPSNLEVMSFQEHSRLHNSCDGWARHHDACVECGRSDRKHASQGRCTRCYQRRQWHRRYPHAPYCPVKDAGPVHRQ